MRGLSAGHLSGETITTDPQTILIPAASYGAANAVGNRRLPFGGVLLRQFHDAVNTLRSWPTPEYELSRLLAKFPEVKEKFFSVWEQGGGSLIPDGPLS